MSAAGRNRRTLLALLGVAGGMGALAFASVPLYALFCRLTGFGGTPVRATQAPGADQITERVITLRFNADRAADLPWSFRPAQKELRLRIGETGLAFYQAENRGFHPTTGIASFNVTPEKAAPYVNKLECFCFQNQTLAAGERVDMPISLFIDPALLADRNLDDLTSITLSYALFRAKEQPKAAPEG